MRKEFRACVKAPSGGIRQLLLCFEHHEPGRGHAGPLAFRTPDLDSSARIWKVMSPVDRKQWPAFYPYIARVLKTLDQPPNVCDVVFLAEDLLHEHFVNGTLPSAIPALVRPAESKRKIWLPRAHNFIERTPEHSSTAEPIVVIEETTEAVLAS